MPGRNRRKPIDSLPKLRNALINIVYTIEEDSCPEWMETVSRKDLREMVYHNLLDRSSDGYSGIIYAPGFSVTEEEFEKLSREVVNEIYGK